MLSSVKPSLVKVESGLSKKRELLAIVKVVTKWKHYLSSKEFVIRTDQRSLRHLLEQKSVSTTQQRWASKLSGLNYRIEYKPGVRTRLQMLYLGDHRMNPSLS